MLSDLLDPATDRPRSRLFWVVLSLVIATQVFALWKLCSRQVQLAQARDEAHLMRRIAVEDCLEVPGASVASCMNRAPRAADAEPADGDGDARPSASVATHLLPAAASGAGSIPVSYAR
jgi:hypothetical protein